MRKDIFSLLTTFLYALRYRLQLSKCVLFEAKALLYHYKNSKNEKLQRIEQLRNAYQKDV